MPKRYQIPLSEEERQQLEKWLKNPPRPYLRERARAILKIAAGEPASRVAKELRVRVHRTTVGEWVRHYQQHGLKGLRVAAGRGRKAAFSPSDSSGSETASGGSAASTPD